MNNKTGYAMNALIMWSYCVMSLLTKHSTCNRSKYTSEKGGKDGYHCSCLPSILNDTGLTPYRSRTPLHPPSLDQGWITRCDGQGVNDVSPAAGGGLPQSIMHLVCSQYERFCASHDNCTQSGCVNMICSPEDNSLTSMH